MADCWTCGVERGRASFCPACSKIQTVIKNTSYFDCLDLPENMGLKRAEIEKAYRKRAQQVHPDLFAKDSRIERKLALEQTTYLNDAYQTLKKARTRAEYLMKRRGHEIGKEDQRVDDMAFLMEMLELRETLESAKEYTQIQKLKDETENRYDKHLKDLTAYFDHETGSEESALKALEQLRFFERFLDEVEAKFDE